MLKYFLKTIVIISAAIINFHISFAQYTRQDTLRGSIGNDRNWWNVKQYNLSISIDIVNQSISGTSQIVFDIAKAGKNRFMQIDLQKPDIQFIPPRLGSNDFHGVRLSWVTGRGRVEAPELR